VATPMSTRKPTDAPAPGQVGPFDHGPLGFVRIPPSEQGPGFLRMLQGNGTVMPVAENWDGTETVPPGIEWVLFPNGDLARVGSTLGPQPR
jgi:hypothetical protein